MFEETVKSRIDGWYEYDIISIGSKHIFVTF